MIKLTRESLEKARDYIFTYGDDITIAWFKYNFENNNTDEFMSVLAQYQYENGGFGGLMYEFEYKGPCLKCTEHAFRYIYYLKEKPSSKHPVIQKMIKYVIDRYRPDIGRWGELLEPGVNDGAHVWWWTYPVCDIEPVSDFDEKVKQYNPNGEAAFAALVALYSELVPKEMYDDIISYPVQHILRYYDLNSSLYGMSARKDHGRNDIESPYNMKCYQMFINCLPDKKLADKLSEIICQNPTACMQLDYSAWEKGYEELPCEVVETPKSVVYPVVKDIVEDSLDYLLTKTSHTNTVC